MSTDLNKDQKNVAPPDDEKIFSHINELYNKTKNNINKNVSSFDDFNIKNSLFEKNFQLPPKNIFQTFDLLNNFKKEENDFYKLIKLNVGAVEFLSNLGLQMTKIEKNEVDVKRLIDSKESAKPIIISEKSIIKNNFEFFSNNTTHSFKQNISSTIYSFDKDESETMFLNHKLEQNKNDFLNIINHEKIIPTTKSSVIENKENFDYQNQKGLFQSE